MSSEGQNVIEVREVSKRYVLGDTSTTDLRDTLADIGRVFRRGAKPPELLALDRVDVDVEAGTMLGVIGRNGAGKSTLLKVISGITEPTLGVCRTRGRVAALLEVGVGFHPELTGRENVYLSGAIYGMERARVAGRLDEIVEFAELERFIDTPVKRYSSGMRLRLGFAVAAHLDTAILVVDEVLAVGDVAFRQRATAKLRTLVDQGRTVLYVSHNLDAVQQLCERTLMLDGGQIAADGPTADVIAQYLASAPALADVDLATKEHVAIDVGGLRVVAPGGDDAQGLPTIDVGTPIDVELDLDIAESVAGFDVVFYVSSATGALLIAENLREGSDESGTNLGELLESLRGRVTVRAKLPGIFSNGRYTLGVNLKGAEGSLLRDGHQFSVLEFEVAGTNAGNQTRLLRVPADWSYSHG